VQLLVTYISWIKTANSGVNSRDPYRNAAASWDILSIPTAGGYRKTRWSPMCCIETGTINMYFHRHEIYQQGLIKFFHFVLKCSISKTVRCFWLIQRYKAESNTRETPVLQKHKYKVHRPCVSVTMDVHLHKGINYAIFKSINMNEARD